MMRQGLSLGSFLIVAFVGSAWAAPIDQARLVTVKVESGALRGSGALLEVNGRAYVITSEHGVVHGNGRGIRHSIRNERYGRHDARLVAADVGNGLALLEIQGWTPPKELLELSDLESERMDSGLRVTAVGFPHRVSTPVSSSRGEVVNASSERGSLPLVPWMIELGGTLAEYGMSGGPLFSQSSGLVVGFLSHQYVQIVPGKPSEVVEFSPESRVIANQVIAIPAGVAKQWVRSALSSQYVPTLIRDAAAQIDRKTAFLSHGVRITPEEGIVSQDGTPIGGDGVGIGGDGMGIGGIEDMDLKLARASTIRMVLTPDPLTAGWSDLEVPGWLAKVRRILVGGKTLEVTAFVKRDPQQRVAEWILIRSPVHFVNLLARTDLNPVIQLPQSSGLIPAAVEASAQALLKAISALSGESKSLDTIAAARAVARFAQSTEWAALRAEDFEILAKSPQWTVLFARDFDPAVEVLAQLNNLALAVSKNRI